RGRRPISNEMSQTEIHQLHVAGAIDHQVFGFQVPMNDALCMCLMEAFTDLVCDLDPCACAQRAESVENAPETFALNELHRDKRNSRSAIKVVNAADVFMCNFPREPQFVFEGIDQRRLVGDLGFEDFERNDLTGFAIPSLEQETGRSDPNPGQDL